MTTINNPDFDIHQIARSGQCFRMSKLVVNSYKVIAFGHSVVVEQTNDDIIFYCHKNEFDDVWYDYFDLGCDYGNVKQQVLRYNDIFLTKAVEYGYGIRILKQNLWETMISFIISQCNNIPRIVKSIDKLCGGMTCFPSPQDIVMMSDAQLQECGLGYGVKYVKNLARSVISGDCDLKKLQHASYDNAINMLLSIYGVGDKVANCVALYGLHHLEAFPVDTWMKRIINAHYGGYFDVKRFGKYAGIVQQYMFFYKRSLSTTE